jgi:hypothetical protein
MNQQIVDIAFCVLIGSCFGILPISKVFGNYFLLIWAGLCWVSVFFAGFIDAIQAANCWYYIPIFSLISGILSYLYLQQYGKGNN